MANVKHGLVDAGMHLWDMTHRPDLYTEFPPMHVDSLRRDFLPDDYMAAIRGTQFKYAIQSQVTQSVEEGLLSTALAEEYYFLCGHLLRLDFYDSRRLHSDLSQLADNPFFVGVHCDLRREGDVSVCADGTAVDCDWLLDKERMECYATLAHKQVPLDMTVEPQHLKALCHVAYHNPQLTLILDHAGSPDVLTGSQWKEWCEDVALLAQYPNVQCKLSPLLVNESNVCGVTSSHHPISLLAQQHLTPEQIISRVAPVVQYALACFGVDRCMFASDWPVPHRLLHHIDLFRHDKLRDTMCQMLHYQHDGQDKMTSYSPGDYEMQLFRENAVRVYKLQLRHY